MEPTEGSLTSLTWGLHSRHGADKGLTGECQGPVPVSSPLFSRAGLESCLQIGASMSTGLFGWNTSSCAKVWAGLYDPSMGADQFSPCVLRTSYSGLALTFLCHD